MNDPLQIDGRCFAYVFPCVWEDHCKIGFSRDPLARISSFHARWYEFFDLDRIFLIEAESIRDARDLELRLRAPLADHRAPAPATIRVEAAGLTEWYRGAATALDQAIESLAHAGYRVFSGRAWLRQALEMRADRLYEWTLAQCAADAGQQPPQGPGSSLVRNALDAYSALDIEVADRLPLAVLAWYQRS